MAKNKKQHPQQQAAIANNTGLYLPSWSVFIIIAVWAYFVLVNYYKIYPASTAIVTPYLFSQYQQPFFFESFIPVILANLLYALAAGLIFFSANGLGKIIANKTGLAAEEYLESCVINTALGLLVLMILFMVIGMARLLYRPVVIAVLALPALYNLYLFKTRGPGRATPSGDIKKIPVYAKLILAVAGAITVIGSMTPETFYDSLSYHLTIPHYWNLNHAIKAIWCHHQSYLVAYAHIPYSLGLMIGNDISTKFINSGFALLSFAAIYAFCKRHFTSQTGILAVLIFYTVPVVLIVSTRAGMEFPLTFIEFFAVYAAIQYLSEENSGKTNIKWLLLSGMFLGLSAASKYTSAGAALGIIAGLAYYYTLKERNIAKGIRSISVVIACMLIVMSPWLIRNFVDTGHPLYPYVFKDNYTGLRILVHGQMFSPSEMASVKPTLKSILSLPWDVTMGIVGQEGYSGAALLLLAPIVLFVKRVDWKIKFLAAYAAAYYLFWIGGRPYLRYFVPAVSVIAIILSYGVNCLSGITKKILTAVLFVIFITNVLFVMGVQKNIQDPIGVVSGMQTRMDYLSTQRPSYVSPYYNVADWINKNLPENAGILIFCDPRGYYINRQFILNPPSDYSPLIEDIKAKKTALGVYQKLKEDGMTHLMINSGELKRTCSYDPLYWNGEELTVFDEFWKKHVRLVYLDIADISIPSRGIFSMKVQQPQWWQGYSSDIKNYVYVYEICDEQSAKEKPIPTNLLLLKDYYSEKRWETLKDTAETLLKR